MEIKGGLLPLKTLLTGDRKVRILVAVGLLGMLLILISQCTAQPKRETAGEADAILSNEAYTRAMEEKLRGLISSIDGVGKAQVLITLESSEQVVYATEERVRTDQLEDESGEDRRKVQLSDDSQSSLVLVDRGSGQKQPLVQARIEPVVKGVVVVCPGAESKIVGARIVEVVTTALGIGASKVCVVKGGT